jgi:DNA-binding GntR family transcriptional regulator
MTDAIPSSSLTERVYATLRADLLSCRLAPGQKLKIEDLCRRLGAGSSAVREALSRLASEGFVALEPQRGFRVTPLSIDELRDLTRTRAQIEALCIRDAISLGDLDWETALIAAHHRMSRTPKEAEGDPKRYSQAFADAHTAFHEALVAACSSRWLLSLRRLLFAQSERYRWLSRPLAKVERDLDKEHRQIFEAAVARDADRCVTLMDEHLALTARILIEADARAGAAGGASKSRRRVSQVSARGR